MVQGVGCRARVRQTGWRTRAPSASGARSLFLCLQGYLAHKTQPFPLETPKDPKYSPTVGSLEGGISFERARYPSPLCLYPSLHPGWKILQLQYELACLVPYQPLTLNLISAKAFGNCLRVTQFTTRLGLTSNRKASV